MALWPLQLHEAFLIPNCHELGNPLRLGDDGRSGPVALQVAEQLSRPTSSLAQNPTATSLQNRTVVQSSSCLCSRHPTSPKTWPTSVSDKPSPTIEALRTRMTSYGDRVFSVMLKSRNLCPFPNQTSGGKFDGTDLPVSTSQHRMALSPWLRSGHSGL